MKYMRKLAFIIKNAFLGLAHKKLLNSLVILSVAIGFLFPIFSISFMNYINKNYGTPPFKDAEHTVAADFFMKAEEESSMEEQMLAWNDGITKAGFFANYETIHTYKGDTFVGRVAGCNSDFLETKDTILVEGRFPTEEEMENGAKVCLAGSNSGHNYKVGTTVTIGGTDFEIIGVFRDARFMANMMLPYKALYPMVEKKQLQTVAYLITDGKPQLGKISGKISSSLDMVQYVTSAVESEIPMMERFEEMITDNLKKSSVIILFSLISFTLIITGRILNEQYVLGVKSAVGATRFQLFLDLMFQNFLLIQIGAAITMAAYQVLVMINDSDIFGLFDGTVIGIVEIVCAVMALIATAVAFIPILRCPVTKLFRNSQE